MSDIITTDAFSPSMRESVERMLSASAITGKLIGVIDSNYLWNIKPLILDSGVLNVLRFSDPDIVEHKLSQLADSCQAAKRQLKEPYVHNSGFFDRKYWVYRRFCQSRITDLLASEDPSDYTVWYRIFYSLLKQVKLFHDTGSIHGHITPENVLVDNDRVFLSDAGFAVYSPELRRSPTSWAPELMIANSPVTPAIDIYGLGLILELIVKRFQWENLSSLISEMQNQDPQVRPSLAEVFSRFERFCRISVSELASDPDTPGNFDILSWLGGTQNLGPQLVKNIRAVVESEQEKSSQKSILSKFNTSWLFVVIAVFCLSFFGYRSYSAGVKRQSYSNDWESGSKVKMRQVALAATMNEDQQAARVVIDDALAGNNRSEVHGALLRFVFGSHWDLKLTDEDRDLALKLALSAWVGSNVTSALPLKDAHPAIVLAVVGSLQDDSVPESISNIPLSRIFGLPNFIREAFELLVSFGVKDFSNARAVALAKLFYLGFDAEQANRIFIGGTLEEGQSLLAVLLDLYGDDEKLVQQIWQLTNTQENPLSLISRWFDEKGLVDWLAVELKERLLIMSGLMVPKDLGYDLLADLLRFPSLQIRKLAIEKLLVEALDIENKDTLVLLSSSKLEFTRTQVTLLVSALAAPPELQQALVAKWFEANTDSNLILSLLASRSAVAPLDYFSVEAASFLRTKEWTADLNLLQQLVLHQDSLVRALAYSKLDPKDPVHYELLVAASKLEKNERIQRVLVDKLQEASQ